MATKKFAAKVTADNTERLKLKTDFYVPRDGTTMDLLLRRTLVRLVILFG